MQTHRSRRRIAVQIIAAAAAAVGLLALTAGPADAHVDVDADNPTAGATNVTVSFTAEAENTTAGISKLDVVLPGGITPDAIRFLTGPPGWHLTFGGIGYTVTGPALPVATDATTRSNLRRCRTIRPACRSKPWSVTPTEPSTDGSKSPRPAWPTRHTPRRC